MIPAFSESIAASARIWQRRRHCHHKQSLRYDHTPYLDTASRYRLRACTYLVFSNSSITFGVRGGVWCIVRDVAAVLLIHSESLVGRQTNRAHR